MNSPRTLAIILFFLLNCVQYIKYIPDPEKDIDMWIENFEQQRSFKYEYLLKTMVFSTQAKGDCVIKRGEKIYGTWNHPDSSFDFEYIGLGDIEYIKKDRGWQEVARGEESDIFTRIKRLLTFDNFEYLGSDQGFLYRFKANIPFLAPDRRKEMIGLIKISERNFLPELIWAGLPDSSLFWETKIYNYNKVKKIKAPVQNWADYLLTLDSTSNVSNYLKVIKKRMDLINIDYKIKKTGQGLILTMPKQYSIEDIEELLACGRVNVYNLAMNREEASRIDYLKDDINLPVYIKDKLFDHNNIKGAKIKFDAVSKPYILIMLKKKLALPEQVAFEIDEIVIRTAMLDTLRKIDRITLYPDMQYYDMEILKAYFVQTLPIINIKHIVEETD